jgi:hypothetical protein
MKRKFLMALGMGLLLPLAALASQAGKVISLSAEVHQFPNASSPLLGSLPKESKIRMSSEVVRDSRGEYWYKTRLTSGEMGYVRAADVKGEELEKELKAAGVTPSHAPSEDPDEGILPWTFVVRVMGLGGYSTGPTGLTGGLEGGGEGELSMSAFPASHGYRHRMLSIGAAAQYLSYQETALLASVIIRFFSEGRAEPELRLRVGDGLTSSSLLFGVNFGVRYPFSLDSNSLFCGYLEGGALGAASTTVPAHIFVSAGLGYHF